MKNIKLNTGLNVFLSVLLFLSFYTNVFSAHKWTKEDWTEKDKEYAREKLKETTDYLIISNDLMKRFKDKYLNIALGINAKDLIVDMKKEEDKRVLSYSIKRVKELYSFEKQLAENDSSYFANNITKYLKKEYSLLGSKEFSIINRLVEKNKNDELTIYLNLLTNDEYSYNLPQIDELNEYLANVEERDITLASIMNLSSQILDIPSSLDISSKELIIEYSTTEQLMCFALDRIVRNIDLYISNTKGASKDPSEDSKAFAKISLGTYSESYIPFAEAVFELWKGRNSERKFDYRECYFYRQNPKAMSEMILFKTDDVEINDSKVRLNPSLKELLIGRNTVIKNLFEKIDSSFNEKKGKVKDLYYGIFYKEKVAENNKENMSDKKDDSNGNKDNAKNNEELIIGESYRTPLITSDLKEIQGDYFTFLMNGYDLTKFSDSDNKKPELVGKLFEKEPKTDQTVLHKMAIGDKSASNVGFWGDRLANLVNEKDRLGLTPLHWSILANNEEMFLKIIKMSNDTTVSIQDENGDTALHIAVRLNRLNMINYLLHKKASLEIRNNQGSTPIQVAISNGNYSLAQNLMAIKKKNSEFSISSWFQDQIDSIATVIHNDL